MKVKVLTRVKDQNTGEIYEPGTILNLDEVRAKQGIANGFLEKHVEKRKKGAKAENK